MVETEAQTSEQAGRLCDEGYALLEMRRFEEAGECLVRARALAPLNPLVHFRLALLFGDTGRLPDALAALDKSIELQPDNAKAYNNRGLIFHELGRLDEAETAYRKALALDPRLEQPYQNLGEILARRGKMNDAVRLYKTAIEHSLDAGLFGHSLAAATGRVTDRAPDSWVRTTFDNFAPSFDAKLATLGYAVPEHLAAEVMAHAPPGLLDILDLGCGTGKCGLALAQRKRHLVGVDLSEKMLAASRGRGLYDELYASEIHQWLRASTAARFDLVVAADVLIYIGALAELFTEVARVLRQGGWFAFSTEECEGIDFELRPTGRYAQSQDYIRRLATMFLAISAEQTTVRVEGRQPISGRLYLLTRR